MATTGTLLLPAAFLAAMLASMLRLPRLGGGSPQQHIRLALSQNNLGPLQHRGASTSPLDALIGDLTEVHLRGKTFIFSHDRNTLRKLEGSAAPLKIHDLPQALRSLTYNLQPLTVQNKLVLTNDIASTQWLFSLPHKNQDLESRMDSMEVQMAETQAEFRAKLQVMQVKLNDLDKMKQEMDKMKHIVDLFSGFARDVSDLMLGEVHNKVTHYREKLDPTYQRNKDVEYRTVRARRNTVAHKTDLKPYLQLISSHKHEPLFFEVMFGISVQTAMKYSTLEDLDRSIYDAFDPTLVFRARAHMSYGTVPAMGASLKFAEWLKALDGIEILDGRGFNKYRSSEEMIAEGTRLSGEFLRAARTEEGKFKKSSKDVRDKMVDEQVERDILRLKELEAWPAIEQKILARGSVG